jgi:uncharacterized protein YlzI (FlbEa/FlbD family)
MKLVKLTTVDGREIHVNPDHIVHLERDERGGETMITLVNSDTLRVKEDVVRLLAVTAMVAK